MLACRATDIRAHKNILLPRQMVKDLLYRSIAVELEEEINEDRAFRMRVPREGAERSLKREASVMNGKTPDGIDARNGIVGAKRARDEKSVNLFVVDMTERLKEGLVPVELM